MNTLTRERLKIVSIDHLKEICKEVAASCVMESVLPNIGLVLLYKVIWYNKATKNFYITSINPYSEPPLDVSTREIIPEDELHLKSGIPAAIKRGNFYLM